jgi:hypothetical protein
MNVGISLYNFLIIKAMFHKSSSTCNSYATDKPFYARYQHLQHHISSVLSYYVSSKEFILAPADFFESFNSRDDWIEVDINLVADSVLVHQLG